MSNDDTRPHTVIATWRFSPGVSRLESSENLDGHRWVHLAFVSPKRECEYLQAVGDLLAPLKSIDPLFREDEAQAFMPKVTVRPIPEPDGEPLAFEGSGAVPQAEAITAILCQPSPTGGHVIHEPRYDFAGLDVLLVVDRRGAPDELWRAAVDRILTSGPTRVRVLLAD
jgi:hypothetical protein